MIEEYLEFSLLLGRVTKKKNRVGKVESNDWDMTINAKGTQFKGNVYFKPIDTSKFTTIEVDIKEGKDAITGRFLPFSVVQEKVEETDIEMCGGLDSEKSLLVFLSMNLEFVKFLDKDTSQHLVEILSKGTNILNDD